MEGTITGNKRELTRRGGIRMKRRLRTTITRRGITQIGRIHNTREEKIVHKIHSIRIPGRTGSFLARGFLLGFRFSWSSGGCLSHFRLQRCPFTIESKSLDWWMAKVLCIVKWTKFYITGQDLFIWHEIWANHVFWNLAQILKRING